MLLNNQQITEEIKKEIKIGMETYIMTKWALSQECKDSSIFTNQSM